MDQLCGSLLLSSSQRRMVMYICVWTCVWLTKAIKRECHPVPTIDDLIHTLNGATVFSKLDLCTGYHQLTLASGCCYITTFATHKDLQKIITKQIRHIPGVLNISDDVIVFGKTQADHDESLHAVFCKFAKVNLTLDKSKCEFNKSTLTFFGFVFSNKGIIAPDPNKIEVINNAPPPTSTSAVQSFLGMATYCAKFIPNFSDVLEPLRQLTKKDAPFKWEHQQQQSFTSIKQLITSF